MESSCKGMCKQPLCMNRIKILATLVAPVICKTFLPTHPGLCATGILTITIGAPLLYMHSSTQTTLSYKPITTEQAASFIISPIAQKMIGSSEQNNLMTADAHGSHIWPKNLAVVTLGPGVDNLYYSLCSTKITNEQVGVVKNFEPAQDKIWFFCTKNPVHSKEIAIKHKNFDNKAFTCIEVREQTAICLNGNIDLTPESIGTTTKTYIDSIYNDDIL